MVARREPWAWEPWEARRAKAPPGPDADVREARADAHLLLYVARLRLDQGEVPFDLVGRLEAATGDARLTPRRQLQAAETLLRIRMAATAAAGAPTFERRATGGHGAGDRTT